ncbi:MAG: hypothetical protein KGL37_09635, partial [Acidobacteriota bacterium]|nr:hypothetical protein [Acidobacteriota bacterium]
MKIWGRQLGREAGFWASKGALRSRLVAGLGTFLLLGVTASILTLETPGQKISTVERDFAEAALKNVSADVQRHYYDPKLRGLNWDALVHEAKVNIGKSLNTPVAFAQIEGVLEHLNDSHTFFVPPQSANTVDYGWKFKIIGSRAYVTEVAPESDAEKKGIRPGEEVLTIDGFTVDRASSLNLKYALTIFVPRANLQIDLRDPAG